ncbi:hypothetical protein ACFOYU_11715 [Microvirga sp. GCM10011540]|uniref:hypothetical protein n=1 Tax=Microvirga sp. GCM10011540 TaxID=3317338 RepID=UPI0036213032
MGVTVDLKAWEAYLGSYASFILPEATAYALNGSMYAARDALRAHVKDVLDRPTSFTVRQAFGVKAVSKQSVLHGNPTARVFVMKRQSAYLWFQVQGGGGGVRRPGNIGPGAEWLFMPVAKELIDNRHGGMKRGILRGFTRRAGLTGQDKPVSARTQQRDQARRPVFFARLYGVDGIWERPDRSTMMIPRQRGLRQVINMSTPRLLVAAYRQETYDKPQFDFAGVAAKAHDDFAFRFSEAVDLMLTMEQARTGLD